MASKTMFLPFYYNSRGIKLVTIQTFGHPARYFKTSDSFLLRNFWRYIRQDGAVQSLGEIVVGERDVWDIHYCFVEARQDAYIKSESSYEVLPISSLDEIFQKEMPAEMMLGIMKVITTELSEPLIST